MSVYAAVSPHQATNDKDIFRRKLCRWVGRGKQVGRQAGRQAGRVGF